MRKLFIGMMSLLLAGAGLVSTSATASASTPPSTSGAFPGGSIDFIGHGYGHGRGMGQYGAYGYALSGWSYQSILAHYYGGTDMASVNPSQPINVDITELAGASSVEVSGVAGSASTVTLDAAHPGPVSASSGGPLQVLLPSGWRSYEGAIEMRPNGQVWNVVPLDTYVEGVVPAESIAYWGASGGEAALQAQAVAARSYALATVAARGSICDTEACQVYEGYVPANQWNYIAYADQAVTSTAGEVLICQGGACGAKGSVALTEYSSSTGGYTAGGAFPAVIDAGDSTPTNPNHTWTASVPVAAVNAAFPSIGQLISAVVTERNGLGSLGGRVEQIALTGTAGHLLLSGSRFANAIGLKSNWFAITNAAGAGITDGYWVVASDGGVYSFGNATDYGSMSGMRLNAPVVGMAPTAQQAGYWLVAADGGVFSFGDAHFYGSTGGMRLNRPVIGMAPTADGKGYWLFASDGGVFSFGNASFHGSTGGMRLNAPIVGMAVTPGGGGYWLVAADGGVFSFGNAGFYGSMGGKRLNQPIVGMVPTADGRGYTLVGRDGGIFTFGDAQFVGSLPGEGINATIVGVSPTADGAGYMEVSDTGRVYTFGDAPYLGSVPASSIGSATALGIFGHHGN